MRNQFHTLLRRHGRDESGASLVEYTVVLILFLLVFGAILDFGRLGFNWVMTEKAMQRAARIATVRPPVCTGVPEFHTVAGGGSPGTLCRAGGACASGGTQTCILGTATAFADCSTAAGSSTAKEIWCILEPILPSNASPNNIWVEYRYDWRMGFAGGPYTPMIEVGVVTQDVVTAKTNIQGTPSILLFDFITPIPALAAMASGAGSTTVIQDSGDAGSLADIPFPDMSVSLPGEDLNHGIDG